MLTLWQSLFYAPVILIIHCLRCISFRMPLQLKRLFGVCAGSEGVGPIRLSIPDRASPANRIICLLAARACKIIPLQYWADSFPCSAESNNIITGIPITFIAKFTNPLPLATLRSAQMNAAFPVFYWLGITVNCDSYIEGMMGRKLQRGNVWRSNIVYRT